MARRLDTDLRRTARRIGLQTAALLVGCLLVVGVVVFVAVVRSQDEQMTQTLTDAVATAGRGGGRDGDRDGDDLSRPRGGVHTAVLQSGRVRTDGEVPPGLPDVEALTAVAASGQQERQRIDTVTGPYDVLTVPRDGGAAQVAVSLFEQHQERERILGALGVAGGAGLLLASVAGAVLARRAVAPMAAALELQRRFVADAGHELRTPLTLLSTRAQLLARRVRGSDVSGADARVARDAEGIVADTGTLTAILEELLLAADVRTPVPQEPVDVGALVSAAVAAAQATAEEAGLVLVLGPSESAAVVGAGAPTALGRSVTALVDNAIEHARSRVDVDVRVERDTVLVEVSDDGPGIPQETLPTMFTRFASGRPPITGEGEAEGTDRRRHFGLGLALVSEIATRHGGVVTATNRTHPGTGAVLRLSLPQRSARHRRAHTEGSGSGD